MYCAAKAKQVCWVGVTGGACIFGPDRNRKTVFRRERFKGFATRGAQCDLIIRATSVSSLHMRYDECCTLRPEFRFDFVPHIDARSSQTQLSWF